MRESTLELPGEKAIQPFVEIERKRPHERSVIPRTRIRIVAKIGEVEDFGTAFHRVEDFAREVRIAILEDSKNEHERFESDDPVFGLADSFADGLGTSSGVGFVGSGELEDFVNVAIVDGNGVMGGCFENCDLEVDGVVACDLGEAYTGLIFYCSDCLPQFAWHFRF